MPKLQHAITKAWMHSTKRGRRMVYGYVESKWVCKLSCDNRVRRVYEDWNRAVHTPTTENRYAYVVPLVVLIRDAVFDLTPEQRAFVEASR